MTNEVVTKDMSEFGYRELDMAGDLLKAYKTKKDQTTMLGEGVCVWLNKNSGNVFLCDEDYNVAMLNDDGELYDFITCPNCGNEGIACDIDTDNSLSGEECCVECCTELGFISKE